MQFRLARTKWLAAIYMAAIACVFVSWFFFDARGLVLLALIGLFAHSLHGLSTYFDRRANATPSQKARLLFTALLPAVLIVCVFLLFPGLSEALVSNLALHRP